MGKFLLGVLLTGSCFAQAGQLDLPLGNPNLGKLIAQFGDSCNDFVNVSNGDCGVKDFDASNADLEQELKSEIAGLKDAHSCSFDGSVEQDTRSATENLDGVTEEFEHLLKEVQAAGQVVGVVKAGWDGEDGDSEYCSVYTTQVFLKNGKVLYVNGDYTD